MTISYNVQHSPVGAFASFTIGHFGTRGGLASQVGRPGDSNVYIGWDDGEQINLLPFFSADGQDLSAFTGGEQTAQSASRLRAIPASEITRRLGWATDSWQSGPLTLTVYSPFFPLPDPKHASAEELRKLCCPAILVRLRLDNRHGAGSLRGVFACDMPHMRDLSANGAVDLVGVADQGVAGLACRPAEGVAAFQETCLADGLAQAGKRMFRLGKTGGIVLDVPAGTCREATIALGVYRGGVVTSGVPTRYWYARYYDGLESVLASALERSDWMIAQSELRDSELESSGLDENQRFLLAQATHSYCGSTAWLDREGEPLWVVLEGEYEMLNTLDLTVDMLFHELRWSPWTVANVLDFFAERYSYEDAVKRADAPRQALHGGISFCHDQGVSMQFSPAGHSSYETAELPARCFSYMSCEELVNWVLCAGVYCAQTGDRAFLQRHGERFVRCLESLLRREDPEPGRRQGAMGADGARCGSGAEITTYDSLDASLGQARNNLYLAVKMWAAHVSLRYLLERAGQKSAAADAHSAAHRFAGAIVERWDAELGFIPAVFENGNRSAILPAIEGLVYPAAMGLVDCVSGQGEFGTLVTTLRRHFEAVFVPGLCIFPGGGWKLSSTSDNSWPSKIAICHYVAKSVLQIELGPEQAHHDSVHVEWQKRGGGYWAFCDQLLAGQPCGSRYYPRGVSATLWLGK